MTDSKTPISVLFFARYKQYLATNELVVEVPKASKVADLCLILASKGDKWHEVFNRDSNLKVACNQTLCDRDTVLEEGDQVAFFPPVTGG